MPSSAAGEYLGGVRRRRRHLRQTQLGKAKDAGQHIAEVMSQASRQRRGSFDFRMRAHGAAVRLLEVGPACQGLTDERQRGRFARAPLACLDIVQPHEPAFTRHRLGDGDQPAGAGLVEGECRPRSLDPVDQLRPRFPRKTYGQPRPRQPGTRRCRAVVTQRHQAGSRRRESARQASQQFGERARVLARRLHQLMNEFQHGPRVIVRHAGWSDFIQGCFHPAFLQAGKDLVLVSPEM
jgi:hypothetical protein